MQRRAFTGVLIAAVFLAACDYPTEVPNWDVTWDVPIKSSTIAASSFLPSGVTTDATKNFFLFTVAPTTVTKTLAEACNCVVPNGVVIPQPALDIDDNRTVAVQAGVTSAVLSGDTLFVTVTNSLGFDPLRPTGAVGQSYFVDTVKSGTTVLGRDSVNGVDFALPSGGTLTRKVVLTGSVAAAGINFRVVVHTKAGTNTFTTSSSAGPSRSSSKARLVAGLKGLGNGACSTVAARTSATHGPHRRGPSASSPCRSTAYRPGEACQARRPERASAATTAAARV